MTPGSCGEVVARVIFVQVASCSHQGQPARTFFLFPVLIDFFKVDPQNGCNLLISLSPPPQLEITLAFPPLHCELGAFPEERRLLREDFYQPGSLLIIDITISCYSRS